MNTHSTLTREFETIRTTHPIPVCQPCTAAVRSAEGHAAVTGSTGATYGVDGPGGEHSATVSRVVEVRVTVAEIDDPESDYPWHPDGRPCMRAALLGTCPFNHRYGPTFADAV